MSTSSLPSLLDVSFGDAELSNDGGLRADKRVAERCMAVVLEKGTPCSVHLSITVLDFSI